jgi:hypothetical protein
MLDGLITFFASHHAIRGEKMLRKEGLETELIPGPKELSPNCGVALRFEYSEKDRALAILADRKVEVDEVMEYTARTDDWDEATRRRRFWSRRTG